MANPTTAAEWTEVAASYTAKLTDAQAKADALQQQYDTVQALKASLKQQSAAAEAAGQSTAELYTQYKAANRESQSISSSLTDAQEQVSSYQRWITNANTQAAKAETGPPATSPNTPPVAADPGQPNTEAVTQPPQPLITNAEPATVSEPTPEDSLEQLVVVDQQQASLQEYTTAAQAGYDTPEAQKQAEDQSVLTGIQADQIAEDAAASAASQEERQFAAKGLSASLSNTQASSTKQDVANFKQKADWRVRLSLAPGSNYLYNDPNQKVTDLLYPLQSTDGVIFPYTPAISVVYAAHYDSSTLTHSNYKIFQYGSSSVDNITITCDFTAQDTAEANYLLAVIHFFKSATKMFYGQDQNPKPGTPPPLCYLSGLGDFQFDAHPLAITGFNYTLPTDVDYIRAGRPNSAAGVNTAQQVPKSGDSLSSLLRLASSFLQSGAQAAPPKFGLTASNLQATSEATYVPTKMSLSITAIPIVTRNDISTKFSLKDYATGKLLQGTKRQGGGIW
jgi:hypothetical protein